MDLRFNPGSKLHCSRCAYWEALPCRYLYLIPSWEMLGTGQHPADPLPLLELRALGLPSHICN